jgi:hypothetical protein
MAYSTILYGTSNVPVFFRVVKYDVYDNAYEHFDFPAVGRNICRRTAIRQLLQEGMRERERERGRC